MRPEPSGRRHSRRTGILSAHIGPGARLRALFSKLLRTGQLFDPAAGLSNRTHPGGEPRLELPGIRIPVVLTGAQLPIDHPLTDALENLRLAFAMAATGQA
ncbi:asparaginase domain-containing protein, partial [Intestinimonas massiliensis]|uniref:asparaginase domain-containing protein n=1 Tax=Intestinimonas massiliensis (ex Afouda et al. 2020) TaxID=1673721 RepID=UPI00210B0F64|nr:asparaginase domain-containing protein [Intestinimonas massiliensis (ex Afouda et al. 2020)]